MALVFLLAFSLWVAMGQPWGRHGFLLLLGLGVALFFWKASLLLGALLLAVALATLAASALLLPLRHQHRALLQATAAAAERRYRHDPCQLQDQFGAIQSITLVGETHSPRLEVRCRTIADTGADLVAEECCLHLRPTANLANPRATQQIAALMQGAGLRLLNDLSVEAKAVRAAMNCLDQRELTRQALSKVRHLQAEAADTLAKAPGNELLAPSIPQLQAACAKFSQEEARLQNACHSIETMLRQLHDFLSVPAAIQPVLNFDLDELLAEFDNPQRTADLEALFAEVVELNTIYRELNRDKLA